ncbi:MAG: hypothetical protein GY711_31240 [bacterium]|nr:hypothetical protein [bacterium]
MAERLVIVARELEPYDPDNSANLGRFYASWSSKSAAERYPQVEAAFRDAIALAPQHVEYRSLAARASLSHGDVAGAVEHLEAALRIDTTYALGWVLLGDAHMAGGDLSRALAAHLEALKLRRRHDDGVRLFVAEAFDQRVRFYKSQQSWDEVREALEREAALRPRDAWIAEAIIRARGL